MKITEVVLFRVCTLVKSDFRPYFRYFVFRDYVFSKIFFDVCWDSKFLLLFGFWLLNGTSSNRVRWLGRLESTAGASRPFCLKCCWTTLVIVNSSLAILFMWRHHSYTCLRETTIFVYTNLQIIRCCSKLVNSLRFNLKRLLPGKLIKSSSVLILN